MAIGIQRKQQLNPDLYDLQERIAGQALETHNLEALSAYNTIMNVIDTAYVEQPATAMSGAYKWLLRYPVENEIESQIIKEVRKMFRETMKEAGNG